MNKEKVIDKYITNLNFIIRNLESKYPKDLDLKTIANRFSFARSEMPEQIMIYTGPYLWKYREYISKEDVEFFTTADFSDDIKSANKDNNNNVTGLFNKIISMGRNLNQDEQIIIIKKAKLMLGNYASYLQLIKKDC